MSNHEKKRPGNLNIKAPVDTKDVEITTDDEGKTNINFRTERDTRLDKEDIEGLINELNADVKAPACGETIYQLVSGPVKDQIKDTSIAMHISDTIEYWAIQSTYITKTELEDNNTLVINGEFEIPIGRRKYIGPEKAIFRDKKDAVRIASKLTRVNIKRVIDKKEQLDKIQSCLEDQLDRNLF